MRRLPDLRVAALALAALAWTGAASAALAQPKGPPPGKGETKRAAPHPLFLSPFGEPFRQGPDDLDPLKTWFEQADAKHQGFLDKAEFRADAARFFKQLDENGDGVIDGFEQQDYETKLVPELAEWANGEYPGEFGPARRPAGGVGQGGAGQAGQGRGQRGGQGRQSASATAKPQPPGQEPSRSKVIMQVIYEPEPVAGADFALDGHITLDEWLRAADDRFEILDADHTGHLTLSALRERMNNPPKAPKGHAN